MNVVSLNTRNVQNFISDCCVLGCTGVISAYQLSAFWPIFFRICIGCMYGY